MLVTKAMLWLSCLCCSPWGRRDVSFSAPASTVCVMIRILNLYVSLGLLLEPGLFYLTASWTSPCGGPTGDSNSTCLKPNSDCLPLILPPFVLPLVNGTNSPSPSVVSITRLFHRSQGSLGARPPPTSPAPCPALCIPATHGPF